MSSMTSGVQQSFNSRAPAWVHQLLRPLYRIQVARAGRIWATRDNNSPGLRPNQYVDLDHKAHLLADRVAAEVKDFQAPILDMACNTGRHLFLLYKKGYRNLHGVDINPNSLTYSAEVFSEMQPFTSLTASPVEAYLEKTADNAFEVSFTRGTSIEFVSPAFPLVKEICRITRDACVLLLHPAAPPFPRLWAYEFLKYGFVEESRQEIDGEILYCFRRKLGTRRLP